MIRKTVQSTQGRRQLAHSRPKPGYFQHQESTIPPPAGGSTRALQRWNTVHRDHQQAQSEGLERAETKAADSGHAATLRARLAGNALT